MSTLDNIYSDQLEGIYDSPTHAEGAEGELPLTEEYLREHPSGDMFGMTLNAGMGWKPCELANDSVMMISTLAGLRSPDGTPKALALHTGGYELGVQLAAAADVFKENQKLPYATFVSDPCDGRTQGTIGMFDSLPYRNDAAMVFRRLIRSLPNRKAILGVASCDKGLPATMMALASQHDYPICLCPGGSTLMPTNHGKDDPGEDAGTIQTIGARFAYNEITRDYAARQGCRACASAGGGCQFLGTAGTSQVVSEGLGLAITHSALSPSGTKIWEDIARASARAIIYQMDKGITGKDILTEGAIKNAMIVHAAFGGSTNLLLHLPAIAFEAGVKRPTVDDWAEINKAVPRIVSVMPIGPVHYPTSMAFMAGGVPEVMCIIRKNYPGLLDESVMTATGQTLGENLDWWENSERRDKCRKHLKETTGVDPEEIIKTPEAAKAAGMTSTVTFPKGNIAPEGSVVKSTAIDPRAISEDGFYRHTAPCKVYRSEKLAMKAIKEKEVVPGDIMIVQGCGPKGTGMEETYQLTSALKKVPEGYKIALITDARFSGVSTGACFGHVGPEALAGGPIGKLKTGDVIEIIVDTNELEGTLNFIGTDPEKPISYEEGAKILSNREIPSDLAEDEDLPDDTRIWAALQDCSGGTWQGCVYDPKKIVETIAAGQKALAEKK